VTTVDVVRRTPLAADEALRRLTDYERHADFIPFTTVTVTGPRDAVGTMVVARTAVGPLGFEDPMELVVWHWSQRTQPGMCRLEKRGRTVRGWAQVTVTPLAEGSMVHWHEQADLPFEGRVLSKLGRLPATWLFGRLVDGLLR
jgi:hypothetical protein